MCAGTFKVPEPAHHITFCSDEPVYCMLRYIQQYTVIVKVSNVRYSYHSVAVPLGETSINFADYLKVKSSVPDQPAQQPEGRYRVLISRSN